MSSQSATANATAQAATRGALIKLLLFAVTLATLPISSYFISLKYMWAGNSNYAAMTAICAANLVLVAYIAMSVLEDRKSLQEVEKKKISESKKLR
ncbi:hypothetical protein PAXRUDRAFT_822957 [Paxillus rubicundulus Ve08.2h10]|uniref:Vacuolar ATPase assembly integral membrane protein VMA21 n=1 Tax=Paxillus rubicundulus Ve08.2h10 TaxID=930991 RepID=A0A0D0ECF2_9AGAM|nr:hypothetical protein PAXRUDRAFT_822957 [Paxillus rubicundulus Ve08.2h10]